MVNNFIIFKEKLIKLIEQRREEMELSSYALAINSGISQGSIYRIEKGRFRKINNKIIKIMEYLSINIKDVIDIEELYNDIKEEVSIDDISNILNLDITSINTLLFDILGEQNIDLSNYIIGKKENIDEKILDIEEYEEEMTREIVVDKDESLEDYYLKFKIPVRLGDQLANTLNSNNNMHELNTLFKIIIESYIQEPTIISKYIEYTNNLKQYKELEKKIKEYDKIHMIK